VERSRVRHILPGYVFGLAVADSVTSSARMDVYPKLSWPVVQRLEVLAKILEWLGKEDEKDEYQQVENVKAIIKAYKDKTLDWNPDLVTYWSKGAQLCQPRPFKMDEFMHINVQHEGHTGFWVEGVCILLFRLPGTKHANKD
jgi:hypothetical protein